MATTPLGRMVEGMVNTVSPRPEDGWTLGWDVVVSYTEKEVNETLNRSWDKHRDEMITNIQVESPVKMEQYDEVNDEDDEQDDEQDEEDEAKKPKRMVKLELGAPKIQFITSAGLPTVNLILPVRQGTSKLSWKTRSFKFLKDTYQITLKDIPIGTIKGKYQEIKAKDRDGKLPQPVKGDRECRFENSMSDQAGEDGEVAWVVLDFPLEGKGIVATGEMASGCTLDKGNKKMMDGLEGICEAAKVFFTGTRETKFRSTFNVLRHALATIKNKQVPKREVSLDLTPIKFCMASFHSSASEQSILSLFIHVAGGKDSGETRDLQGKWGGLWLNAKSEGISPIPSSHTASILIHPQLIYDNVLLPSLRKKDSTEWEHEQLTDYEGGGIALHATWKETLKIPKTEFQKEYQMRGHDKKIDFRATTTIDPWALDLKKIPAKVHLRQRNMDECPVVNITWEFSAPTRTDTVYECWLQNRWIKNASCITRWLSTFKLCHDLPSPEGVKQDSALELG